MLRAAIALILGLGTAQAQDAPPVSGLHVTVSGDRTTNSSIVGASLVFAQVSDGEAGGGAVAVTAQGFATDCGQEKIGSNFKKNCMVARPYDGAVVAPPGDYVLLAIMLNGFRDASVTCLDGDTVKFTVEEGAIVRLGNFHLSAHQREGVRSIAWSAGEAKARPLKKLAEESSLSRDDVVEATPILVNVDAGECPLGYSLSQQLAEGRIVPGGPTSTLVQTFIRDGLFRFDEG